MKKFFIALSVMAALIFSVVPSQAIIGVADTDALGVDAIVPFITELDYVNKTGLNTLMVFTDVLGADPDFHYTVYTTRSETVYDDDLPGTKHDIIPTDAYSVIAKMAPAYRSALEVDLDGDGTNDHYAGYIWFDSDAPGNNAVGCQVLFVDLAKGIAASTNIPMKEWIATLGNAAFDNVMLGQGSLELFSPAALMAAKDLQTVNAVAAPTAPATFGIYPRYYIAASGDATWLMIWQSANDVLIDPLHVDWYDNEENDVSSNIPVPDEFTIINVEPLIPEALYPAASYPKEGWIDMTWLTDTAAKRNLEMLGWTFIQAYGTIGTQNTSWGVLNEMWRDVQ